MRLKLPSTRAAWATTAVVMTLAGRPGAMAPAADHGTAGGVGGEDDEEAAVRR